MNPILVLSLLLLAADPPAPSAPEIRLTIFRDPYTSSEQATICRVRADNLGPHRWSGRAMRFEARAVGGGAGSASRQRGRFGLELAPYGSLETLIVLPGRHDRFEVILLSAEDSAARLDQSGRHKGAKKKRRRPVKG